MKNIIIYIHLYLSVTISTHIYNNIFSSVIFLLIGAVSIATLLIGYYHGLLLRNIDADLLISKMCSTGLLTGYETSVISSGHTVHHKNWLLLEHVRHFELRLLLEFCQLVKEEWVEIGSQLIAGMYVYMYTCSLGATCVYSYKPYSNRF